MHLLQALRAFLLLTFFSLMAPPIQSVELTQAWTMFETDNYILYTDNDEEKAQKQLYELEVFASSLKALVNFRPGLSLPKLTIYQFEDSELFNAIVNNRSIGGYYSNTKNGPIAVISPNLKGGSSRYETLFHEYIHFFQRGVVGPKQPLWYSEGLADFFSSLDAGKESTFLGGFLESRVNALKVFDIYPLTDLFNATQYPDSDEDKARFYATAWIVTHFMKLGGRNGFEDYNTQLNNMIRLQQQGLSGTEAFAQSFDISPNELMRKVRSYGRKTRITGAQMPLPEVTLNVSKTPLSLGRSYAVIAQLLVSRNTQLFTALLNKGVAENDALAKANLAAWHEFKRNHEQAKQLIEALTNTSENDYQAHTFIGEVYFNIFRNSVYKDTEAANKAIYHFKKSIKVKQQAYSLNRLFDVYVALRLHTEADQYAQQLYQAFPLDYSINRRVGLFMARTGNKAFAKFLLNNVLAWSNHERIDIRVIEALANL